MWVFCEVPGRHVSLSLQVGDGETRSDFTRAKVRPPSWSRSGPHLFPTRPLTSRLSQRPAAASCGHGRPSPPREPPSLSRREEDAGFLWALAQSSLQRHRLRPGRFPGGFLAGQAYSSSRIVHVGPICGGARAGVAVGTGFKRFHLRM